MLTNCYTNILCKTVRRLNVSNSAKSFLHNYNHTRTKLLTKLLPNVIQCRNYQDQAQNLLELPALTDEPKLVWPSFLKSIRNFIQCKFVNDLDPDFDIADFLGGSRQALHIISHALAAENYDSIQDLVSIDALNEVRGKISSLNSEQKQLIAVNKEDVYLTFPYIIGIMFDDNRAEQKFVEITVVYHSLRGLKAEMDRHEGMSLNMLNMPDPELRAFVSNYRFIREFTRGIESSWTVNKINHFMKKSV